MLNEIIKPGEKLKKYRKMLGITQGEIAEDICSKNNVCLIEKGKQKISDNLAIKFCDKLNDVIEKKGLNIEFITVEFLMEDKDEQANHIFASLLNELKETETIYLFEQKFQKNEELIEKYNITDDKKIELYKLAADFYYGQFKYSKSNYMCYNGLEISINIKNKFEETLFYIYKSRNNIFMENYIKSLEELDIAEKCNTKFADNDLTVMIIYHRALTYKKLGEYDTALEYFEILKQFEINDYKMLLKIKMVYANCLTEKNIFQEAEKEYLEIIDMARDDKGLVALAYRNIAELHFNNEKYKDATKYIKDALMYSHDNKYLDEILYIAAKVLKHENEDVETYLLQSLEICEDKDRENFDLIKDIINELVIIYMEIGKVDKIITLIERVKKLNVNCNKIYAQLSEYYRDIDTKKSKYFSKILIDNL